MMFTIRGIPTAGIAVGTAFVLQRHASAAATAAAGDPVAEAGRFHAALERAKAELSALAEGEAVFAAHLEMAGDPMLAGLVEGRIAEKHLSAEQALGEACEEVCGMFAALDDDYLRGRTDDVRDVCARIGRILSGETAHDPFAGLAPGTIVVADELAPSDTAQMDFSRGRRIGDGARKRDEPCRDHRPEQGHRGAGRRCRVHAAGQNRRPADNRRGSGAN